MNLRLSVPAGRTCLLACMLACLSTLVLSACGGGGGGGGSGNGNVPPPSQSPGGTFTLSGTTVSWQARSDTPTQLQGALQVHVSDTRDVAAVGAAYVAPNQPADWLIVGISGSGANYSLDFSANTFAMAPGTHTAVVSIGTATASGRILQRRDVTVTLVITEITVVHDSAAIGLGMIFGHSDHVNARSIHVNAPAGRTWNVTSTVPWIQVPSTDFTGPHDVDVVIDAALLPIGMYEGELQFTSKADLLDNTQLTVMLGVASPALTFSKPQFQLGGVDGNGERQTTVLASLDTGANSYPVSLTPLTTSGGNWLSAQTASTMIGSSNITLNIGATPSVSTPGRYGGMVRVDATVLGQTISDTIVVYYNQDQDRLVAATLGVAFSKLPTRSVLSRKVRISDSAGRSDIPWTATDDASWLTVTPSGTTGSELQLTANPAGLATNQIYYATVTVTSPSALIDNTQVIRVALKVGTTDPVVTSVAQTAAGVVANPVEPWVYASLLGGAIEVRDVHTGGLLDTFDDISGADGGALEISDDGLTLFAIDGWTTQRVRVLDARTGEVLGEMPLAQQHTTTLHYMRPNGHPVLITGGGEAFDVATRSAFATGVDMSAYYPSNKIAHTSDHRFYYSQYRGITPPRLQKGRIAMSTLVTERPSSEILLWSEYDAAAGSVCVSADDSRVMTAAGSFTAPFTLLDAGDLSVAKPLAATTYGGSNVACLWNGLYMGSTNTDPPANLFFYDAQGNGISSLQLYGLGHEPMQDRIIVSGDASRVIAVTGGPSFHTSFYNAPLAP